jgi:hypothetical protein
MVPCCWDAIGKMIGQAEFPFTMSGFALPPASARRTRPIPMAKWSSSSATSALRRRSQIGDGDTGYGNALNVVDSERLRRCRRALGDDRDQVSPSVAVTKASWSRLAEAQDRSGCRARPRGDPPAGGDTDLARPTRAMHGLDEAIWRAKAFSDIGADILFIEAPHTEAEMARMIREAPGVHMANMVEGGATPILSQKALRDLGYGLAIFPLTLFSAAMKAVKDSLAAMRLRSGEAVTDFAELRREIGRAYYAAEQPCRREEGLRPA